VLVVADALTADASSASDARAAADAIVRPTPRIAWTLLHRLRVHAGSIGLSFGP
jgi:hypothetical protein